MIHQLQALDMDNPRASLLKGLVQQDLIHPEVLSRLGAFHIAVQDSHIPLRELTVLSAP